MTRQTTPTTATGRAWSYIAGEKGRNRVRVYERARYGLSIDYRTEEGARVRHRLGYSDRSRAKCEADDIAAKFGRAPATSTPVMTLRTLFDIYEREVSHEKGESGRGHDKRTLPLLLEAFGPNRKPESLNRRDWDSYIHRRRSGELAVPGHKGQSRRDRVLEQDLKLLLAVLNWAERAGSGHGGYLLDRNPLRGLDVPREVSPRRPMLNEAQFVAVRQAAVGMSPDTELFVMLAWYTGHRCGSIRQLRWADVDLAGARIHWRGEVDKIGYDHWNPLHPSAVAMLKAARARSTAIGEAWIFDVKGAALSRHGVQRMWRRLAKGAGIPKGERYGWHSCRRAFANRLRHASLRDLKDLGGWKTEQTVVAVYQQASESAQRSALLAIDAPTGTGNGHKDETSQKQIPAGA